MGDDWNIGKYVGERSVNIWGKIGGRGVSVSWWFFLWHKYSLEVKLTRAVPWLRRLVVGLSPRRPGFDPGSVHMGFVVEEVALGRFFPECFGFPLPISFHRRSITRKNEKTFIFITGLHNRPQGCGASVASAAGPLKKSHQNSNPNLTSASGCK
jgi:hypothetical protein